MHKLNLHPSISFVRVRVEGVPTIENGRIFYLSVNSLEDDWKPPMEMPGLSLGGKPCIEHWASSHMPTHCQHCDKVMQYHVAGHSWGWMTGVFYCPSHPLEAWVDTYPKRCHDTSQDLLNAWPQYADRAKKIPMATKHDLLRYQVIDNEDAIKSKDEQRLSEAPLLFTLTPDGLVRIPFSLKTNIRRWWQGLVGGKAMSAQLAS